MKEEKEENKIVEEEAAVVNEKDIINPEEVKEGEAITVDTPEVIIEGKTENTEVDKTEVVTSTGDTKEDTEGESKEAPAKKEEELVAKLSVYYDKVLKIDIKQGAAIKDIYEKNGIKLTKKRAEELVKAGVAELK